MFLTGSKMIGLTIDETGIRYASLRKKKAWTIDRSGFLAFPSGIMVDDQLTNADGIRGAFKKWVNKEKLAGANVTLAVPTSQIIVRKMRIPSTNTKELRHLIELEVETTLHLPFEEPVYDYLIMSKDEESTHVLIFAAPLKWIRSIVDLLQEARLRVKMISFPAAALARSIFTQQAEKTSETMVVHLGESTLEIFMFHEGSPIFMRTISLQELGGHEPGKLSEHQVGELTAEISRILNFYQFGLHEGASQITKAIVAGAPAAKASLIAALSEAQPDIDMSDTAFRAFEPNLFAGRQGAYLLPAGLALPQDSSFKINLMPRRATSESKRFPSIIVAALSVWLLLAALSGYSYFSNRAEDANHTDTVQRLNDQIALLSNQLASSAQSGQSNPLAEIEAIKNKQRDVVAIARELDQKLPAGADIRTISITGQGQVAISAGFIKLGDISRYLFDLHRMTFAQDAILQTMSRSEIIATSTGNGGVSVTKPYSATFTVKLKPLGSETEKEEETDGTAK
ncbi:type IV pilus assembly protein PilM [Paenibacillus taihuensis]|uniref:Type IV pilus assembly protein PilM n=1 Tax=Paenibacillus taihuensis TaxID=1156355 RepID=A0A3D9R2L7_9BACL|nr:pilus assembly protein PilM [Paenibacillus taihuensis]REE66671.1 type IV pilus assembly protein PilM [Paenibacillus taihuensis]